MQSKEAGAVKRGASHRAAHAPLPHSTAPARHGTARRNAATTPLLTRYRTGTVSNAAWLIINTYLHDHCDVHGRRHAYERTAVAALVAVLGRVGRTAQQRAAAALVRGAHVREEEVRGAAQHRVPGTIDGKEAE